MAASIEELHTRARRLRLILLDVDGVLTDGTVSIHSAGGESKAFHIRDGAAIVWAAPRGSGGRSAERPAVGGDVAAGGRARDQARVSGAARTRCVATGRSSRAADVEDDQVGVHGATTCWISPVLGRVGLSAAPADAVEDVRAGSLGQRVSRRPRRRSRVASSSFFARRASGIGSFRRFSPR